MGLSKNLIKDVKLLKRQSEALIRKQGGASSGDLVEVDYFALDALIIYFEETRSAATHVIRARDALHQVFFPPVSVGASASEVGSE